VPAYQRKYNWSDDKAEHLFNDIVKTLPRLKDDAESFTFLGSIITVFSARNDAIPPLYADKLPPGVVLVIDGQQRLTSR
jgi:uncharacterized protein with ParB-like and HNH nuclease domain